MSKNVKLSKIVQTIKNCQKFSKLSKIVKIVENCQKCPKLLKKNVKNCQKLSKIVKIVQKNQNVGQVMFPHHSDQMFQKSQVSWVTL